MNKNLKYGLYGFVSGLSAYAAYKIIDHLVDEINFNFDKRKFQNRYGFFSDGDLESFLGREDE